MVGFPEEVIEAMTWRSTGGDERSDRPGPLIFAIFYYSRFIYQLLFFDRSLGYSADISLGLDALYAKKSPFQIRFY